MDHLTTLASEKSIKMRGLKQKKGHEKVLTERRLYVHSYVTRFAYERD